MTAPATDWVCPDDGREPFEIPDLRERAAWEKLHGRPSWQTPCGLYLITAEQLPPDRARQVLRIDPETLEGLQEEQRWWMTVWAQEDPRLTHRSYAMIGLAVFSEDARAIAHEHQRASARAADWLRSGDFFRRYA